MEKIYLNGYVFYEDRKYTFTYEDSKLSLIDTEAKATIFSDYKYVDYFCGHTLDGFDIIFYINKNIYYHSGFYICSPRCFILSMCKSNKLDELQFNTIRFSGGIVNRFYSNRKMIEFDPKEERNFKYKNIEETVLCETVNINGMDSIFEFSIMLPGWKDDGIITFNNYDSLLRIKYNSTKGYKEIIKDLSRIDSFFKFCANRVNISFDKINLEIKNNDGKYEIVANIYVPYMTEGQINKDMINYDIVQDHLNDIFKFLDSSNYIFSIIPENNKVFESISNKDYCAAFSCFESIYQYVKSNCEDTIEIKEELALKELQEELLPLLDSIDEKYKGNNKTKRDFVKRFKNIINTANLKLEKCIIKELEQNDFIIESIYYERRDEIKEKGISESVMKAVSDRDNITHNNTVKLDNISIGIYEMISKMNYVMIFNYVGISKEKYANKIVRLGLTNII